jgi:hypothetical protein
VIRIWGPIFAAQDFFNKIDPKAPFGFVAKAREVALKRALAGLRLRSINVRGLDSIDSYDDS